MSEDRSETEELLRKANEQLVRAALAARDAAKREQALREEIQAQNKRLLVANEELARATRQAEAALRTRDVFLTIAAHELKTPITSLRGFAQTLLHEYQRQGRIKPEHMSRALEVIDQQSSQLAELVLRLLYVAHPEGVGLELVRERVELVAIVKKVVAAAGAHDQKHTFVLEAPVRAEARIDPLCFEQVIANLVDNAIRFSPEGGPIEITVAAKGAEVEIALRDHGIGIAPEHWTHLFDRFYQAHEGAGIGGMGLGLFISKEIVTLHHERIEIERPPDGGTRFVVCLPSEGDDG